MNQPADIARLSAADDASHVFPFTLDRAVDAGSCLRVRTDGLMLLMGMRAAGIRAAGDGFFEEVHRYDHGEQRRNWNWYTYAKPMITVRTASDLPAGTVVELVTEPGSKIKVAELSWELVLGLVDEPRAREILPVAAPVTVAFEAGAAQFAEAFLKSDGRLFVNRFDAFGNPARSGGDGLTLKGPGLDTTVKAATGPGATVIETGTRTQGARFTVTDGAGRRAVSNALPRAVDGTPIFFGGIHWHTDFSGDGQRGTEAALRSARDELALDFAGPADHMSASGGYGGGTPSEQARICRSFDRPGIFVTIPGAELSARYGHTNIYAENFDTFLETVGRFPAALAPAFAAHTDDYAIYELAAACPDGRALFVPHHANMDSQVSEGVVREDGRPYWCAMHWPLPAERKALRLVEIVQNRGCFEAEVPDPDWKILYGGLGGSARTALMRGYRVGFIAGTDNHSGRPTRKMGEAGYGGVTAVQTQSLETGSIFRALHERRCYATSGARIVADATLNGYPMGSEITQEPGAPREFRVSILGTAPIVSVQVVHMGYVLHEFAVPGIGTDFSAVWADERAGRPLRDAWYYVRARQADGHCVWLSPFWVDLPE